MADGCGDEASGQKTPNWGYNLVPRVSHLTASWRGWVEERPWERGCWGYYEANFLVEIWADEEIQRQLSAMGRKNNIWENIAAELNNGYKCTAWQCKTKIRNLEQKYKKSKKCRLHSQKNERNCDTNFNLHSAADV